MMQFINCGKRDQSDVASLSFFSLIILVRMPTPFRKFFWQMQTLAFVGGIHLARSNCRLKYGLCAVISVKPQTENN